MVLLLIFVSIGIGVIGQLLFKMAANTPVDGIAALMQVVSKPTTLVALALYVGATLLWITVLSRTALSYAYPLLGLNYVLVVVLSAWVLGEPVSIHRWIGVCFIAVGFAVTAGS